MCGRTVLPSSGSRPEQAVHIPTVVGTGFPHIHTRIPQADSVLLHLVERYSYFFGPETAISK